MQVIASLIGQKSASEEYVFPAPPLEYPYDYDKNKDSIAIFKTTHYYRHEQAMNAAHNF